MQVEFLYLIDDFGWIFKPTIGHCCSLFVASGTPNQKTSSSKPIVVEEKLSFVVGLNMEWPMSKV